MQLFTIGFTKKTAQKFFSTLSAVGVKRIVDIRLNTTSQLSGFAKQPDLCYFLQTICGIDYRQLPVFAPSKEILSAYKKKEIDWDNYEKRYSTLLQERRAETIITTVRDKDCLLCSEDTPEFCHRRLAAEYIQKHRDVAIVHLT